MKLSQAEQDHLASKYGLTRSGLDNQAIKDEELLKIPEPKVVDVKKEVSKPPVKVPVKRSNRRGTAKKHKSRKSK